MAGRYAEGLKVQLEVLSLLRAEMTNRTGEPADKDGSRANVLQAAMERAEALVIVAAKAYTDHDDLVLERGPFERG